MNFTNPMTRFRYSKMRPAKYGPAENLSFQIFSPDPGNLEKIIEKFVRIRPSLYTRMKVFFNKTPKKTEEKKKSLNFSQSPKINYRDLRVTSTGYRSATPAPGKNLIIRKICPEKQKSIQRNLVLNRKFLDKDQRKKKYLPVNGGKHKREEIRTELVELSSSDSDSYFEYLSSRLNTNS